MQFLEITPRIQSDEGSARQILMDQQIPRDLTGEDLVVFCAGLWLSSHAFANGLLKEVLCERKARSIILIGPPEKFLAQVRHEADRLFVADRVTKGLWRDLRLTVPREVALKFG